MLPLQVLRNFRLVGVNPLSPIPEIANSATISPELSPEPVMQGSQSSKVISPNMKIRQLKKSVNLKIEKKGKTRDLANGDSFDLNKVKKTDLKIIKDFDKKKLALINRPETSKNMRTSSTRSVFDSNVEESKDAREKLPKIKKTFKKINDHGKQGKNALRKGAKRKEITSHKFLSKDEEEVQRIVKLKIN